MTIIDEIVASTRVRVENAQKARPLSDVKAAALAMKADGFPFRDALAREGLSFICEVKRASPSKGLIAPDYPYADIARSYAAAGADAISVLTEPEYFLGDSSHLAEISALTTVPTLRKDFVVSEYQIFEAKTLGASAVLLISSVLPERQLAQYIVLAESLGMSALVETRSEEEMHSALSAGAGIIGVNNRDLSTFDVDLGAAGRLRGLVPDGVLFVAESGITSPDDIRSLAASRPNGVLIGEALMRAGDKALLLREFREAANW